MNLTTPSIWEPQPQGAQFVAEVLDRFRSRNPAVVRFEQRLKADTGGRLADWTDHLLLDSDSGLRAAGYVDAGDGWFQHPAALLPPVCLTSHNALFVRVDSVTDFAVALSNEWAIAVNGQPLDARRTAVIAADSDYVLGVIERHGCTAGSTPAALSASQKQDCLRIAEQLRLRRRQYEDDHVAYDELQDMLRQSIAVVGRDMTCDLFFQAERGYWQSRNRAGRVQYMRQQAMGLGWGNHDHHTFRSSRHCFHRLIESLELLGFQCRERFYAGAEAGWGAQVIEQPVCGVVIFADVDLSPSEISGDFAHAALTDRTELGTIGIWCALHGEAMFQAGMHHLECQFDFDGARDQLAQHGVVSMKPFTDFPFLRQCFTEGERWPVSPARIDRALRAGLITAPQAAQFAEHGAVGSHLEILERNDGYRGFNQTGINDIILRTDPRRSA